MIIDPLTQVYLTGIAIVAVLMWWTSCTRTGRKWLKGYDDKDKNKK